MQVQGKEVAWNTTGATDDLGGLCALAAGAAPDGQDALALKVDPAGLLEMREERTWPVEGGRAYYLSVLVKTELQVAYGQVRLEWLDGAGAVVGVEGSAYTFGQHDFVPVAAWGVAPAGVRRARAAFRLQVGGRERADGTAWLAAACFEPTLALAATPTVPWALFGCGQAITYSVSIAGAPADLALARLFWALTDYSQQQLASGDLVLRLEEGLARVTLALPALEAGYYELALRLEAVGMATMRQVRTFGCLPALDFTPPADYPIALDAGMSWPTLGSPSSTGSDAAAQRLAAKCAACAQIGLRTLRDRMHWGQVHSSPGQFVWGKYAEAAEAQHAAGIAVYQIIHEAPTWALGPSENDQPQANFPPADPHVAYELGYGLAKDLGHAVRYFEWWNEPDIFFYGGHPWDLAALTKSGYLGIKAADRTLGVLGPSRCASNDFFRKLLANGAGEYMDIFNQHSYGAPEEQFRLLQDDRAIMAAEGVRRPIWMTEMGRRSTASLDGSYTLGERLQVSYLLRAYACGLAAGNDRFFYFYLQEFLEYGYQLWGLQRADLSPKPAFVALGTLVRQAGRARVVGVVHEGERYCVVFERQPGDYVGLAWSLEGSPVKEAWAAPMPIFAPGQPWSYAEGSLELPLVAGAYLVNPVGQKLRDLCGSSVTLPLSYEPVFIRGLDATRMSLATLGRILHYVPNLTPPPPERAVWLQALARPDLPRPTQAQAQVQKNALFTAEGQVEEVGLWVHNYGAQPAQVSLSWSPPDGWLAMGPAPALPVPLTLAAHASMQVRVRAIAQGLAHGREYCLTATLQLDGRPRDRVAVYYTLPANLA